MSTLSLEFIPGYQFSVGEIVTLDKLNLLGRPTINLIGSIGSLSLADGSVTTPKLADNALAASTTGRGKMQDGFFSADATGRAKFGAGFFAAGDATSLALFADGFLTGSKLAASAGGIIAASRNLLALNNAGTPNSKVDVTADEVLLKDSSNKPLLVQTVSVTLDITLGVALNGLETGGAENASHWYYIWLISDGTNLRGVLKDGGANGTSSGAPDLSGGAFSGYTYKALIGAVRNDGSSNFVTFYQQDRMVWVNDAALFTAKQPAVADTYESYQAGSGGSDVDLRTMIPAIAKRLSGTFGYTSTTGGAQGMFLAADANGLGAQMTMAATASAAYSNYTQNGAFIIPLKTAQTFYWKGNSNVPRFRVTISGYTL